MSPPTWLFLGIGVLFVGLGTPMALRKVPPNGLYGVRVPATLRDERVWYETNAVSGRDLVLLGVILIAGFWALPTFLRTAVAVLVQAAIFVFGSAAFAIRGVLLAIRLEARYRARDRR